jgi:hypothetical protein
MKVVLMLGAGATVSDVATRPAKVWAPLDQRFFSNRLRHRGAVDENQDASSVGHPVASGLTKRPIGRLLA